MKYCTRCVMPDTKPGVFIDENGLCNACRSVGKKFNGEINWEKRQEELRQICEEIKAKNTSCYDCLVPVSGGKDSWHQARTMKEVYGMKVLTVCMAAHLPTTEGIHNLNAMVKNLGVDLIKITLKPSVYKSLRRKAFFKQAEPNWAEHCAVFSGVVNIAKLYEIPLIVWGEDIAVEFGGAQNQEAKADAKDINHNDLLKEKTIFDWLGDDISPRDVFFYRYPDYSELEKQGCKAVYLGYYHLWDGKAHYESAAKRGFHARAEGPLSGNFLAYDNIDEKLCEINIWLKYIKFGFWRATDQACYQVWNRRMKRQEAVKIVNELQDRFPVEYFQDFLRYHSISEKEFWEVVEKNRNLDIWKKDSEGKWKLKFPLRNEPPN